jgi:uncharacterized LabA/DUF88 family protein
MQESLCGSAAGAFRFLGRAMLKVALLIDGGHLRSTAAAAGLVYDNDFIENFSKGCHDSHAEVLQRILYYDCPQYRGRQTLPVSGTVTTFSSSDGWLEDLGSRELFAVRRGTLAFRGWVPRKIPVAGRALTDADFKANFEQKGVDMRIGLDLAVMCSERRIERVLLVSADTDLIPAMKHTRKAGIQVVGIQLPKPAAIDLRPQFLCHVDFKRAAPWPARAKRIATAPAAGAAKP